MSKETLAVSLDQFLKELEAAKEAEVKRVVPEVSTLLSNGYVVITQTSPKTGNKYISVRELGNPKIMGFGRAIYAKNTDGTNNTSKIVAWKLDLTEYTNGVLSDGMKVKTRKGYEFTIKNLKSERTGNMYWAVVKTTDSGKERIVGLANQRYSQIKFSFRVTVEVI